MVHWRELCVCVCVAIREMRRHFYSRNAHSNSTFFGPWKWQLPRVTNAQTPNAHIYIKYLCTTKRAPSRNPLSSGPARGNFKVIWQDYELNHASRHIFTYKFVGFAFLVLRHRLAGSRHQLMFRYFSASPWIHCIHNSLRLFKCIYTRAPLSYAPTISIYIFHEFSMIRASVTFGYMPHTAFPAPPRWNDAMRKDELVKRNCDASAERTLNVNGDCQCEFILIENPVRPVARHILF